MKPLATLALVAIVAAFCVGVAVGSRRRVEHPATLSMPPGSWPLSIATRDADGRPITFRLACDGYVKFDGREDLAEMVVGQ